ncbi:2-hydroxyhepta-2,4-diene-1,7-dioate isomerase [Flavonifractor sp. An112]|uniref:fumarylacetoacetate hydrolase family protein n=1 Tax=Flavonifractor sp. An112 TaxID=1965544 RepID=UPI000B39303F|nr:fumarylacetoacetate hydrolase family protein [Flavonifractor sp. An112]OUQ59431.1 2-hydroxyhepta-2,4-diene-1,7-dioate isomerase [Flavonifractor sp. An112]
MRYVKLLRDGKGVWGVLQGDLVRTLTKPPFEELCYDGASLPLEACRLVAPCEATKIVCVGKNYYDHAVEMGEGVPDKPILFLKAPNTLNHPEGSVHAPGFVERLDYEGELAFVIRRRAKDVKAENFADYILGYTCLNDVTARDVQKGDGQWTRGKSMDGFAPIGPVVTDEVDPAALAIETRLNGVVVQQGNTSQFMTAVPQLLEFITASMTLEPGDVVTTGTPAGIGPMAPGDTVEVTVQGIGTLRNHII